MPSLYTTSDRTKLTCVFVSGAKTTAQAELRPNIIEMFLDSYKTNQTHRYTKALMTFSSWVFSPHVYAQVSSAFHLDFEISESLSSSSSSVWLSNHNHHVHYVVAIERYIIEQPLWGRINHFETAIVRQNKSFWKVTAKMDQEDGNEITVIFTLTSKNADVY